MNNFLIQILDDKMMNLNFEFFVLHFRYFLLLLMDWKQTTKVQMKNDHLIAQTMFFLYFTYRTLGQYKWALRYIIKFFKK